MYIYYFINKRRFGEYKSNGLFVNELLIIMVLFYLQHAMFLRTKLPATASLNDYLEYIKSFPLNDDPSLFGMHSNADISYAQAEAYACLTTLLNTQSRELGVVTTNIEELTTQITKDMLSTISEPFDLIAMQVRYGWTYFCICIKK